MEPNPKTPDSLDNPVDQGQIPMQPAVSEPPYQAPHPSFFRYNRTALLTTAFALILIVLAGFGGLFLVRGGKGPTEANQSSVAQEGSYAVGSVNSPNLSDAVQLQLGQASSLAVNGQLQVNDNLVLAPTAAPDTPVTGEVYYDKTTNQPYYYNGSSFVSLSPTPTPQHVTSVGGVSGIIGLGSGLSITNNQLAISSSILQNVAAEAQAPKVSSLQGQTGDVTLTAGSGISINGTTISSTGIQSLQAGNGIAVSGNQIINNGVVNLTSTGNSIKITPEGNGVFDLESANGTSAGVNSIASNNSSLNITNDGEGNYNLELAADGVSPGPYGTASTVAQFTVNAEGQLTGASTEAIAINGDQITSGTIGDSYLSSDVALYDAATSNFTGALQENGYGVCTTSNNCVGVPGGGIGGSGAAGTLALFTSLGYTIGDSVLVQSGGNLVDSGDLSIQGSGGLSLGNGSATTTIQAAASGSPSFILPGSTGSSGQCLTTDGTDGVLSFANCLTGASGGSGGVTSLNSLSGSLQLVQGNGLVITNGTDDITIGLAATTVASGTYGDAADVAQFDVNAEGQLINAQAIPIAISGNQITSGTVADSYLDSDVALYDNETSNFTGSLQQSGNDVCTTSGNCVGVTGGSIGGSGEVGVLPVFTGSGYTIGNSVLSQSDGDITDTGYLAVQGSGGLVLGDSTYTTSLIAGTSTSNLTFTLPGSVGSSGQCLTTDGTDGVLSFANCLTGAPGQSVGGSGTAGTIAVFTNDGYTIGNSALSQDSNDNLTASGNLNVEGAYGLTLGSSSDTTTLVSGSSSALTFTLPGSEGTAGQCLTTDGSADGVLSFANCLSGSSGGSGGVTSVNGLSGGVDLQNTDGTLNVAVSGSSQDIEISLADTTVTPGTYGDEGDIASFTVNAEGQLTGASTESIAINGDQITSGAVSDSYLESDVALYDSTTSNFTGTLQQNGNDVCTISGNCVGVEGGSIGGSGATDTIAMFTGSGYTIGNADLTETGGNLAASGDLIVQGTGGLVLGSGSATTSLVSSSSSAIKLTLPSSVGSSGQCLVTDGTGTLSFATCLSGGSGGSSGVASLNGLSGSLDLEAGTGESVTAGTDTITLGLAPTAVASGTYGDAADVAQFDVNQEGQLISASSVPIAINGDQITSGAVSDSYLESDVALYDSTTSNFTGTLQQNGNDVCTISGNCVGVEGGSIGGSGATDTIAMFTGSGYTIGDSALLQDGSGDITDSGSLTIAGSGGLILGSGNSATTLLSSATTPLQFTLPGSDGTADQCLITDGTNGILSFATCLSGSGSNGGVASLNGLSGVVTVQDPNSTLSIGTSDQNLNISLADSGVTAGSYGSGSNVAYFTVNAYGQLTTAGSEAISINGNQIMAGTIADTYLSSDVALYDASIADFTGVLQQAGDDVCTTSNNCTPSGTAEGDLKGSFPNPQIASLQGTTLTISSPSSGQLLAYNGTAWVNTNTVGQLTVQGTGVFEASTGNLLTLQSGSTLLSEFTSTGALQGGDVSGSNKTGTALYINGGQGTGSANGGNILLQISGQGHGSGSSNDALNTVATISGATGAATFQNYVNSTTAFQIQNAAGANVLTADTANNRLLIGTVAAPGSLTLTTTTTGGSLSGSARYYYEVTSFDALGSQSAPSAEYESPAFSIVSPPSGVSAAAHSTAGSLSTNTTYYYEVTAACANGETTASSEVSANTGSETSISLFWTAVPDCTNYRVYRGTSSGGENVYYSTGADDYTDTGLTGTSAMPPTTNTATTNSNTVTVSWPVVPGAYSYRVYYGTTSGGESKYFATTANSYTMTSAGGTSATPPTTAANTYSEELSSTSNYLTNTVIRDAVGSTSTFQVQNSSGSALLTADTTNMRLGVDVTYASMSAPTGLSVGSPTSGGSLTASTTYYYKVTAIDSAGGETTPSTEASGSTDGSGDDTLPLTWTAVTGASGYRVYRATTSGGETYLTTVLTNSFTDTGSLAAGIATPPSGNTAYVSTNVTSNDLELSVGGLGTPTGQLYVSGTLPTSPISQIDVSSVETPYNIQVSGNYLYIALPTQANEIYDISNPLDPVFVSSFGNTSPCTRGDAYIHVAGSYAYTTNYGTTLLCIFNIANPVNPIEVSNLSIPGGGNMGPIYTSGNYAYVLSSSGRLIIVNISNPAAPQLTGVVPITAESAITMNSVYVQGNYVYVAMDGYMQIVNVSNPANPVLVSTTTISGASSIYVQGGYAYVGSNSYFYVYDIDNPAVPSLVGSLNAGANSLSVQGRYAYLGVSTGYIVVDISNPAAPEKVGTVSGLSNEIYVQGRYLYEAFSGNGWDTGISIYDLGGEYTQQLQAGGAEVGTLQVDTNASISGDENLQGALTTGQSIQDAGNLGVSGGANIIGSMNLSGGSNALSSPAAPTVTPEGTTGSTTYTYTITATNASGGETLASAAGTTTAGNATLSATNYNQISWTAVSGAAGYKIYRTVGGSTTGLIGSTTSTSFNDIGLTAGGSAPATNTTNQLTVQGSVLFKSSTNSTTAFQVQDSSGASVLTADTTDHSVTVTGGSNPAQTVQAGSGASTGTDPDAVAVSGNYAYVVNYSSSTLQVFNISNPADVTQVGSNITTGTEPDAIAISGNYAYVVNYSSSTLQVFNISNPADVTQVGSNITTGTEPDAIAISGNYAYVVNYSSSTLQVFNISNPADVTQVGSNITTGTEPDAIAISGNYAYVLNYSTSAGTMQVFNISNPASVTQVGSNVTTEIETKSIAISGNYAYVTSPYSDNFQVFNISNPASVTQAGSNVPTSTHPYPIAISGNYAYVTNYVSGNLQVFNISNPADVTQVGSNITTGTEPRSIAISGNYAYVVNYGSDTLQTFNINPAQTLQVNNAGGSNILSVDTTGAGNLLTLNNGNSAAPANVLTLSNTGAATFENAVNSTTAFQIQNSSGSDIFDADTQDSWIGIGTSAPGNLLSIGALTTASSGAQIAVSTGGTTNSGIVIQDVASQSSGYAFQLQNSSGTSLASIDYQGNLVVQSATITGVLTVNGHIVTGNTTGNTTATINTNAGTGGSPSCTVSGDDTAGQITLTTGTAGWAAGAQCTINFSANYAAAPHPVIAPASNTPTAAVSPYVTSTATTLTVNFINADTAQNTYTWNYFNAQ